MISDELPMISVRPISTPDLDALVYRIVIPATMLTKSEAEIRDAITRALKETLGKRA